MIDGIPSSVPLLRAILATDDVRESRFRHRLARPLPGRVERVTGRFARDGAAPLQLTPDLLLQAYAMGVFPMADDYDDPGINWIEPRRRGVIPLDAFHVPRSLAKAIRRGGFEIRVDHGFETVIRACAEPTPERPQTWLNETLIAALCRAGATRLRPQRRGLARGRARRRPLRPGPGRRLLRREHVLASARFQQDCPGRAGASGCGPAASSLLDAQFLTAHLERFGAVEISRAVYLRRLRPALAQPAAFPVGRLSVHRRADGAPSTGGSGGGGSGSSGSAHSISQTS